MTTNLSIVGKTSSDYLLCMEGVIARSLREGVAGLPDPRIACPRHSKRLLESIVEMLAGFTLGTLGRSLHAGMVRWFGDSLAHELLRSFARVSRMERLDADVTYLDDAKQRPIVNELATRLHLRYCSMSRALEGVLGELETLVRLMAPHKHRVPNVMLGTLCNDADELVYCLTDEIRFAWSMFSAAAAAKPVPGLDGRFARSAAMWSTWVRVARMSSASSERSEPSPPRDQAQSAGYIMLVA